MSRSSGLLLVVLLLLVRSVQAASITAIHFEGNASTREVVMRQELLIREGDESDPERIEASRQAIMNLGLFKSVKTRLERDAEGEQLTFHVVERFYLLPIPLVNAKPKDDSYTNGIGRYSYGIELRHDNVFGLNHRMKLVYENKAEKDEKAPTEREYSLRYHIPRLVGSPYQFTVSAGQRRIAVGEYDGESLSGSYVQRINDGSFSIARWLNPAGISQGWLLSSGMSMSDVSYDDLYGATTVGSGGKTLAYHGGISYHDIEEHPYYREGKSYGYALSLGLPQFGADSSFTQHSFYYRRYQPLSGREANLNTQLRVDLANGEGDSFAVGHSTLLRGYDSDTATGNARLLLNAEYHRRLSGYPQLRGVLFTDIGNAWPSLDRVNGKMLTALGVGLRWRVQSFVNLTLRVDYAYALETEGNKLSLNTSASF